MVAKRLAQIMAEQGERPDALTLTLGRFAASEAPALAAVTDLSRSDWRMGAPFFLCAALQAVALWLAVLHFRRHPG
jgi:hypothetical protein